MRLTIELNNASELEKVIRLLQSLQLKEIKVVSPIKTISSPPITKEIKSIEPKAFQTNSHSKLGDLVEVSEPTTNLNDLLKAQAYKGPNKKRFQALVKNLAITEPIDELINQLSK